MSELAAMLHEHAHALHQHDNIAAAWLAHCHSASSGIINMPSSCQ
jgi:hypothetical protein